MSGEFYVATFASTSHAVKIEKILPKDFHAEMIPTPTEISHRCGLSLRIYQGAINALIVLLEESGLPYGLYALSNDKHDGKRIVRTISIKDGTSR